PHCLADRGRDLAEVKDLETRHAVSRWRGPLGHGRQLRADFLAYLDSKNVEAPRRLPAGHGFWTTQDDAIADDLVTEYAEPSPPAPGPAQPTKRGRGRRDQPTPKRDTAGDPISGTTVASAQPS